MAGKLTVCATPIGNLDDITFRALEALKNADLIAAEDTRHTLGLLNHFEIRKPLISCHQHNETERSEDLVARLLEGQNIVYVSDAGTPAISDPGQVLVDRCVQEGIEVTSLPGACAFVTALSGSGMPSRRFVFEGFLPAVKKERREVLDRARTDPRTVIFYEAPHRLKETLKLLETELGDRTLTLARELTKIHEEYRRTTLSEARQYYETHEPHGEYVLILAGAEEGAAAREQAADFENMSFTDHMKLYASLPEKEAMKAVAKDRCLSKRDVYAKLLEEKNG